MESAAQQHRLEETNLEAENEILDDEEDDDEEFDWERPSMVRRGEPAPETFTLKFCRSCTALSMVLNNNSVM